MDEITAESKPTHTQTFKYKRRDMKRNNDVMY